MRISDWSSDVCSSDLGQPEAVWPWISRQSSLDNPKILNGAALEASEGPTLGDHAAISEAAARGEHPFQWSFHYDDEPADIVALDMAASAGLADPLPAWRSATTPPSGVRSVPPGSGALAVEAMPMPVLVVGGER